VVAEGVEQPGRRGLLAELLAEVPLPVLHLPHEQFSARLDVVRHDVHPADEFHAPFLDELAEGRGLLGVSLDERLNVRGLVQREPELGVLLHQMDGREDVREPHLQVLLSREEHRRLPVRVRDQIQRLLRGLVLRAVCTS